MARFPIGRVFLTPWLALLWSAAAGAGTITGSFTPIAQGSVIDLTQAGTTDWVHWGLYTETSANRKYGVPPLISNYQLVEPTQLSYVVAYQYSDNWNGYTWYDGTPALAETDTTTGLWAYQAWPPMSQNPLATGYGFQISVPADNTTRILKLYVGSYAARGQLRASLSDGGSYTDTSLSNASNGPGGAYTLNYRANSPGQTLTVQWTLYQQNGTTGQGNVTLQAAALTLTNANNPPLVSLTAPADASNYPQPATINLAATASDLDGTVTNVSFLQNGTLLAQDGASPYEAAWNNVVAGRYRIAAVATDNGGGNRSAPAATVYVHSGSGSLTALASTPPAAVDLTAEGTADWVHLGSITNTTVERKAGVTPQITVSVLGTNELQQFTDSAGSPLYSWSDGTPTEANPGAATGVRVYGYGTNGFHISAPADRTPRKLRVYVGCYGLTGRFEAYLSDFSGPGYIGYSVSSTYGTDYAVCEMDYAAASDGQTLVATFQAETMYDSLWGEVRFQAATLQASGEPLRIKDWSVVAGTFQLSFPTESGRTYTVRYSPTAANPAWTELTNIQGTGGIITVSDPSPPPTPRFYQVIAP